MDAPQRRGTDLNLPGLRFIPAPARNGPTERQNPIGVNMDESRNPYNRWYRRIRTSHAMSQAEVVECCRIGGLAVSRSMVDAWGRRAGTESRRAAAMTEEQFEDYARLKSQDNLSLWSPWMNSLDDSDCWTATRMGPGTFSHDTGPGTKFPACHICGGLKPGTGAENQFIAAAIGHKKTCLYYGK